MQTMSARIAARPAGEAAKTLAEDIRTWFGKDRAGKNNVIDGANPKVEGLETAWAIEAPAAKLVAVAASEGFGYHALFGPGRRLQAPNATRLRERDVVFFCPNLFTTEVPEGTVISPALAP